MNKTTLTIAALLFTGAASANPWLEDSGDRFSGLNDSSTLATAIQPGIGDSYGGNVFEKNDLLGSAQQGSSISGGSGDAYASPIPNVEAGTLIW